MTAISIVAAVARNGTIGRAGALPWHLPADLRRFRELTLGKPVLMGRKTYASIGRALPGRMNLVLTRDLTFRAADVRVVHTLPEAMAVTADVPEMAVIGGADVYRLMLPAASWLHLTEVEANLDGDTRFPAFDIAEWRETARERHPADARNEYAMSFVTLARRGGD